MATFSYTNSKGVTYYLYTKEGIQLRGAKTPRSIFFFSKEAERNLGEGESVVKEVPAGYKVEESARNGFVYLKKA
jgi:hypothetical protein